MVTQLAYISTAADGFSADDLADIVACARKNNPEVGVTGVLILRKGQFLQVLEGEDLAVDILMRRIRQDRRHHDVLVIHRKTIKNRDFEYWAMGWTDNAPNDPGVCNAIDRLFDMSKSSAPLQVSEIYFLIQSFRQGLWEMN